MWQMPYCPLHPFMHIIIESYHPAELLASYNLFAKTQLCISDTSSALTTSGLIEQRQGFGWHKATTLCMHTHGNESSAPSQTLLPHPVTKAISNKYTENYATINSILTAAESFSHCVLSLAGILSLKSLHYVWIHVRFHFANGDLIKKKASVSPGILCLTSCQMTTKTSHCAD